MEMLIQCHDNLMMMLNQVAVVHEITFLSNMEVLWQEEAKNVYISEIM